MQRSTKQIFVGITATIAALCCVFSSSAAMAQESSSMNLLQKILQDPSQDFPKRGCSRKMPFGTQRNLEWYEVQHSDSSRKYGEFLICTAIGPEIKVKGSEDGKHQFMYPVDDSIQYFSADGSTTSPFKKLRVTRQFGIAIDNADKNPYTIRLGYAPTSASYQENLYAQFAEWTQNYKLTFKYTQIIEETFSTDHTYECPESYRYAVFEDSRESYTRTKKHQKHIIRMTYKTKDSFVEGEFKQTTTLN
ncbi:hypothetical protein D2E26_0314 [Bifidobacterium dolichotidis]|uniref:Uncharacterized protein n=1 Tax=Bifidobacterium dolichotidis TaxID=2306976 RepID=A0A430FSB0_9BIFI|nr:hypothetical protein [Bifidobacterium dolichotidis]RSX55751.1 hypothetical protein D2E26_0314 [Bifidobacterium dolichotidis]